MEVEFWRGGGWGGFVVMWKPIFMSNPNQLNNVEVVLKLELSLGFDNIPNILSLY